MKVRYFFLLLFTVLLASCSSTKNTGGTRWYHSFNTKYNVYFNGKEAFNQAFKSQQDGFSENYSEMIIMFPVSSLPKDKSKTGGPYDKAIEKSVKAIKTHSIQTKPDRKQGKQNDPKYKEFMSRTEYNPFLHNAWMMMAKSQFYNGDFLEAASSFSYISRLYDSQPEISNTAKIWKARCYSELDWFYEADEILSKLKNEQLTKNQKDFLSAIFADNLIKQKQYADAVPFLKTSIQSEKNKLQRTRQKYLLGQLYATTGQKELAYKTFKDVPGFSTPYIIDLSANIRQTEVYPGGDISKMSKKLNKMTKNSKNQEYLDQIYYAMGNVYMLVPDTIKAIESYELGVEKSVRGGVDKMLNQIRLGDIYFDQRKFLDAQPNYSEALGQIKKSNEAYPRVSKRSEALDALVIHFEAVELQDSLQRLSRMTEEERMAVITKIIENVIKKEKEEQEKAKQEENLARQNELQAQQQANRPGSQQTMNIAPPTGDSDSFYFYNPQVVAIGKNTFQQKWGRRTLEDDWRRRNKASPISDSFGESAFDNANGSAETSNDNSDNLDDSNDRLAKSADNSDISTDLKDPQFYLQQIPFTEEELEASDLIISTGLFNMGIIYKDMLEDKDLALESFESLNTRFPDNENKLMAYYNTYLIYWRIDDMVMANQYKSKIREEFPESDFAIAMADPDYEYNQKRMIFVQDSLYQQTYSDYLDSNITDVRENYEWISTKYNQSVLMPKFMFLNALSFAVTNEPDTLKILLKELVEKYPNEDVAALASEIIKGFQRGLLLSASGDNMLARGSLFNMRFGGEDIDLAADSTLQFSVETATSHELLFIYPTESLNDNLLLYVVAGFNFGNYMINDFGLERTKVGEIGILRVTGFNHQDEVIDYLRKIQQPDGYAEEWSNLVIMVPISVGNYSILSKGKSLDEYMTFFEDNFAQGNEKLIALWRLKQAEEMEVLQNIIEEPVLPEIDDETKDEIDEAPKEDLPVDSVEISEPDSSTTDSNITSDDVLESVNTVYNKASYMFSATTKKYNDFTSDPIRWFLNLFKRDKKNNAIEEYAKQQEKEEKERMKQLKKEQEEKDRVAKEANRQKEKEQNDLLKKQAEEEKAIAKAKQQEQKELDIQKAAEKKQKEDDKKKIELEKKQKEADKKRLAKEKKQAQEKERKAKEKERNAKEKARKEEQKRKEKEREELRKQKERERKARTKK